jgi:hypothetical protein
MRTSFPFKAAWAALAVCLLSFAVPVFATGGENWEFIDEDDGVHTWKKELDGDMPAFRGQTFIRGTIDDVLKPVMDWKHHTEWMYLCRESTLLKELSSTRALMYNRVKGVWPVWDRDVIADTVLEWAPDHKALAIHVTGVSSDLRPLPEHVVRMPMMKGFLKMWQVEPEKVKVLYQIEADIGGRIPKWLANLGAKDLPYHTLRRLRERVEKAAVAEAKPL